MNDMYRKLVSARVILIFAIFYPLVAAGQDMGNVIPFQGQLANQSGQPLSQPSPGTLVFRLYRQAVGGGALWEESQPNISVNAGRFSVLLGSRTELPDAPNFNTTLYLGITVDDGNAATADVEMRPRQALVPIVSASYSKNAGKLNGYEWSVLFGTNNPATGVVLSSKIATNSIAGAQIVSNSITAGQISPGTITPTEIKSSSITLALLAREILDQLVPPGTVSAFAGHTNVIPDGWLLCDGRALSSGPYPRLYAGISTNWGSGYTLTGSNTWQKSGDFNLPDLRGMFLRGVNGSRSDAFADPDVSLRTNTAPAGSASNMVGSVQADQLVQHNHKIPYGPNNSGGANAVIDSSVGSTGPFRPMGQTSYDTGGNETRPKNAYVNYIIKY